MIFISGPTPNRQGNVGPVTGHLRSWSVISAWNRGVGFAVYQYAVSEFEPVKRLVRSRCSSCKLFANRRTTHHAGPHRRNDPPATLVHATLSAQPRRARGKTDGEFCLGPNPTRWLAGDWLYMQAFQIALRCEFSPARPS